jgi:hypothetical protein
MPSGLLQLVARGSEDKYITVDPQITFFKSVYRRHTIFSQEFIPLSFSSQLDFGKKSSCKLTIEGDLINDIWLVITLPAIKISDHRNIKTQFAWIPKIGYNMINYVEIEINGKIIDKHYGEWMCIWNELTVSKNKRIDKLIGDIPELTEFSDSKPEYTLYIPLQFWFCRASENSLPIASLQFCDAIINVSLHELDKCYNLIPTHYSEYKDILPVFSKYEHIKQNNDPVIFYDYDILKKRLYFTPLQKNIKAFQYLSIKPKNIQIKNSHLLVNYIFLDTDERALFTKVQHDYLVEQLWVTPDIAFENLHQNISLFIKNPCKIIIWKTSSLNNIDKTTILLNNRELFNPKDSSYFKIIQPYQHFNNKIPDNCYMYSFALQPESHQPSGSLNASNFDSIKLSIKLHAMNNNKEFITTYAIGYNLLRISNGFATLLFQS